MPNYVEADRAREIVRDAYAGEGWKRKVDKMSDRQVYAIFFSICERDEKKRKEDVRAMANNIKATREIDPILVGSDNEPIKVKPHRIDISYGTPFMMSELERLRKGEFKSIKQAQEERRQSNV